MLDLMLEFAGSGRIGPIHGGMPLTEAFKILGPGHPHPAIRLLGDKAEGYPYDWDSLSLSVTRNHVSSIRIEAWPGKNFSVPPSLAGQGGPQDSTITKKDFLAALDDARIDFEHTEVHGTDQNSAIRIIATGVSALFGFFDGTEAVSHSSDYLISVSKFFDKEIP
ncbi:hypothetical protein [Amycolatopsis alba]|uniref:hypothetical protein n=1 Tax=Amycolatopsis alba TaxID=76020 RepID=UPI0011776310|nr:hypothetical protein [Amycolatopsis alba]